MEIKWSNVVALGFVVLGIVLAVRHHRALAAALGSIAEIGPGHTPQEQTLGLCVIGVLCAAGVAVFKLALQANERKDK